MSSPPDADKRALRRRLRSRLEAVEPDEAERAARRVAELVRDAPEFERAPRVGLYAAHGGEVPTRPLFEQALADGKICLFPRVGPGGVLRFVPVTRWEDLRPGRYGVPEPPEAPGARLDTGDLVLVPGVAFDRAGRRLGRGRGHYDRTFGPGDRPGARVRPTLFGVGFELQLVGELPHGPRDGRVDAVVTERGRWRADGAPGPERAT